ncbi:hypothetical protein [Streptomyces stelliscabiei]|uniref:hypothetical protein n=1 Tax=Streptomyces stelliscabiei TaxID=146820 RepID=UPI0029BEF49D|nr:hypothetical protein [Streptomyces stelliscabiei]MDX2553886.1 hypothetical protein [Streptomyces stelliscabiei]MDX2612629.1 hypothetical protein [Streptomyces stelliscabiei]MDX2638327.1 hypothetical protein [Streptomyces stelliscabiei]MDX2663798.1 hypothetical protein [Streptomyces stelliscabiei]MDX2715415.1 hypothetical protein [Streptomyces stelliscabiei]
MAEPDRPYGSEDAERERVGGGTGSEGRDVRLPEELRALGRALDRPGADGDETMVERVLGQILAERVPTPVAEPPGAGARLRAARRWLGLRRRALTAALCGLLTVLVLTPPVRAAVADFFDFGGVEVRYDPSASPSPGAGVPGCPDPVPLAEAGRRAGFAPLVPGALGTPDAVSVTRAPKGRFVITLCWEERGHTVRLDEYAARLAPEYGKTVAGEQAVEWVRLGAGAFDALWFPEPHLLRFWMTSKDGSRFTRSERTAGPTLLWVHGEEFTLRLEGVASKDRARKIAESLD